MFLLPVLALLSSSPASAQNGYVGSAVCRNCHPNVTTPFFRNPHNKLNVDSNPVEACESCHGPAQGHIDAKTPAQKRATILRYSAVGPKAVLDNCLQCHAKDVGRREIRRSEHTLNDVVCTNCHSVHNSPTPKFLLAKQQATLCYDCHGPIRAQFNMPFKHRVNEGVMQCSDCHNPHGAPAPTWRMSARPRMVDQALGNEQPCLRCHADLRGPFLFEHAAVRVDGCETCHAPHGSTNARLLRRPVVYTVCLECHNGAGNFGKTGQGIPTHSPSHNMADPRFRNCTTCHVRIHGSNSDPLFTR